jgi:hypothetical protein
MADLKSVAEVTGQTVEHPAPAPSPTLKDVVQATEQKRATIMLLELITSQGQGDLRNEFARDLIGAELVRDKFNQDQRLAMVFATCGEFAEVKGKSETQAIALAMAKIQMGRSWGLEPPDAMKHVFFQNGKPCIEAEPVAAKLRNAGWDWDIDWPTSKEGRRCGGCILWPKRFNTKSGEYEALKDRNGKPVSVGFTEEDASVAMIWEKDKQIRLMDKWNYRSWPADMYFARAIMRFKKRYASDVMTGAMLRDEAEELQAAAPEETQGVVQGTRADQSRVAEERLAELRARGARINELPNTTVSSQQEGDKEQPERPAQAEAATDQPASSATDSPAPSAGPRTSYTDDELKEMGAVKASVANWLNSIGRQSYIQILGNNGVEENLDGVSDRNWKTIAAEMNIAFEDQRKAKERAAAPQQDAPKSAAPPVLQFGGKRPNGK